MTYSLRVKAKPSIEVRESLGPAWLGLNDAVSTTQIRVVVSKLLATFLADSFTDTNGRLKSDA